MLVHRRTSDLRAALATVRGKGDAVSFVPTMGYLHEGHAALIRRAAQLAPRVVVSVFVNPLQFGPREDFERYPRDPDRDLRVAAGAGATDVWFPAASDLTPPGLTVKVEPGPLGRVLCGKSRPGHFRGVCTIVAKLFHVVQPDYAVFGWKDAQQLVIIRRMVADLDFPVHIEGVETVREADGLAMSSRNSYLSAEERARAVWLSRSLFEVRDLVDCGRERRSRELEKHAAAMITQRGGARLDYVRVVSLDSLRPLRVVEPGNTLVAAAAWFGQTRLIDNVRF